jgi:hypothetical protein
MIAFNGLGMFGPWAKPALAVLAALIPMSASGAAAPDGRQLTVVELFTSQGCSSCPPANENLIAISQRPGILALTFSVTYWDRLGWKDTFGKPEFTTRQRIYEPSLGHPGPFTPQVVVNGSADVVGNRLAEIEALLAKAGRLDAPSIEIDGGEVRIGSAEWRAGEADVWLVRYDPEIVAVAIPRGENGGRTLPQTHVVHELSRIGGWDGRAVSLPIARGSETLKVAVLVQKPGGPIVAASTD